MKKTGIFLLMAGIIMQAFSQEVVSKEKEEPLKNEQSRENTKVTIGDNLFSVRDDKDALHIRIGNRGLEILESLEGNRRFSFEKYDDEAEAPETVYNSEENERRRNYRKFKGHWSGIEFGLNSLLTAGNSFVMPDDIDYMTLHTGKSSCFNLNFTQQSFGFTRRIGLVTGLGFNWNNYTFDGNNNIVKGANGVITEYTPVSLLKKSKLTTVYLTLPVLLEVQIPTDSKTINLSGGVIGAVKLGSHSKMVFENREKVKSDDDFSLNVLRYGPTLRAGFENLNIYATWYATPMFKNGKGPGGYELHPFEIGLSFTFND